MGKSRLIVGGIENDEMDVAVDRVKERETALFLPGRVIDVRLLWCFCHPLCDPVDVQDPGHPRDGCHQGNVSLSLKDGYLDDYKLEAKQHPDDENDGLYCVNGSGPAPCRIYP